MEVNLKLPPQTKIPKHLVIIPDGNRRWAKLHNLPPFEGHRRGFEITTKIARAVREFGIHTLTIWAFSTENWDRSKEEIRYLMKMYEWFIDKHLNEAKKDKVRLVHLGRKDRLPETLIKKISQAEAETKNNDKNILNIALDYGGRDELLRVIKKIIDDNVPTEKINEELVKTYLDTQNQPFPYPDLLIRTSGEQRTSGIFPWQGSYVELYFEKSHFPDLTPAKIRDAIIDYSSRDRRFGGDSKKYE